MIVSHLAVIFPVFQETQMVIIFIARAHHWNLYLADFLNISSDISRSQLSIYSGVSSWIFSVFVWRATLNFLYFFFIEGPSANFLDMSSHGEYSRQFVGRLTVNYLRVFLGDSRWIISMFFFWATHGELSPCFVGRLTANYLHVLLCDSQWIISMFCWATHGELSPCFVGRLTVNYLHVFWATDGELSPCFVGRPKVKYLYVLLGDSRWIISIFCWATHGELFPCFVGRLTVIFFRSYYGGHNASSGCGLRNDLQIWWVAANILNKQSRTADKMWSSSLGVGRGVNNSSP